MAKTVLVVDDSISMRSVVGIALKGAGYDVMEASNGREGLRKLGQADHKVHLIISDVNMPIMDGFAFLKEVKQDPAHKFTPVVMLTTETHDAKKQQFREAGARAWIAKPFQPDQLVAAVSKLVS